MAQGVLPFKYESEKKTTGITAPAGLPVGLDLTRPTGLSESIEKHLKVRKGGQGWADSHVVLSLVLLNLAGSGCVDDIKILEANDGVCEVLKKSEMYKMYGLRRKVKRALLRRRRKEKTRTVPSASSIFCYLEKFHDSEQEKLRRPGKAFISAPKEHLQGFAGVNKELADVSGSQGFASTAALDMDTTLAAANKIDNW